MESVLALKLRTGEIDEQSLLLTRRRLEADLGQPEAPVRELCVAEFPASADQGGLAAGLRAATLQPRADAKIFHGESFLL